MLFSIDSIKHIIPLRQDRNIELYLIAINIDSQTNVQFFLNGALNTHWGETNLMIYYEIHTQHAEKLTSKLLDFVICLSHNWSFFLTEKFKGLYLLRFIYGKTPMLVTMNEIGYFIKTRFFGICITNTVVSGSNVTC